MMIGRWIIKRLYSSSGFIAQPTYKSHPHLLKPNHIIPGLTAENFTERRKRLANLLPNGSTAIIPGYRTRFASKNIFYPFQQNNNLLYLTGFNEPDCCLVLEKRTDSSLQITMFVEPNDPEAMLWSGPKAGLEGIREFFGIESVQARKRLDEFLEEQVKSTVSTIYLDYSGNHCLNEAIYAKLKSKSKPIASIIESMRLIKSTEELALMRQSGKIASEAFIQTMRASMKFRNEYQVSAEMEYQSKIRGAQQLAYVPVVAGGNNSLILHYVHNNQQLNRDNMLLMDAGAQFFGYCSDISRTWPLSGRFSMAQRKLYEAVLRVQEGCLQALKAAKDLSFQHLNDIAVYLTAVELDKLGFQNVERHVNRLFPHSIGHHLGLDLHDCPSHSATDSLVAGNVITVEPGLYIPHDDAYPKEFQGIGIRIEDDVVIKGDGIEILTSIVPKQVEAIEQLLN